MRILVGMRPGHQRRNEFLCTMMTDRENSGKLSHAVNTLPLIRIVGDNSKLKVTGRMSLGCSLRDGLKESRLARARISRNENRTGMRIIEIEKNRKPVRGNTEEY